MRAVCPEIVVATFEHVDACTEFTNPLTTKALSQTTLIFSYQNILK